MEGYSMKIGLLIAAASAALLSSVVSSAAYENAPGVSANEIKIGATFPFSGPGSALAAAGKGFIAYVNFLNDKGGIDGRRINLIALDDAYSPPKAVEQTRRLIESDEVAFIFGQQGTPTNSATAKYLTARKIPHLFIITGSSKFANFKEYPYTTTGIPNYKGEGRIYAKYVLETLPTAKIAILYQNDDLGKDFLNAFKSEFKEDFGKKVIAESYEVTEPTIDSHVVSLKSTGAEVLFIGGTPKFAAQAIRKSHEIGWKALRIVNFAGSSIASSFRPAGLEASTGVISATIAKDPMDPKSSADPGVKWFRDLLGKYAPGSDVSDLGYITGINEGMLLEQVLKQCGHDLSRENILKQARSIKDLALPMTLPGVLINTDDNNNQAFTQLQLQRFNGTGWESLGAVRSISGE
jgi:ABC-type branched-subunit amino acid transport system substrate-binding protein